MFPQIFGKYVLERELASGGMAVVYLATLRGAGGFEKRLVVKQIRAELASDAAFVERFVTEAKTTVGLSHPNIVPVYELGVEQGVYFIAMELAQGVTLSELLKTGGRLSPEEGAYLGVEISRALDYAHRKAGIVHRDVTPRNVLIDEEGAVRLIDFGIAAPVSGDGSARERVYGSPGHMPLEQLRGGRLTPATDVFAVGALLFEAWTTEPPFRRATKAESDTALTVPPPALSLVDAGLAPLDDLLSRAVAAEAAARPQSTEELARPLREFLRTADLGDIARRLGERVRRARRASQESVRPPPMSLRSAPGTPVTPVMSGTRPFMQSVTETFAAREEVVEWTRPRSEPPLDVALGFLPHESDPEPLAPPAGSVAKLKRGGPRTAVLVASAALAAVGGVAIASRTSQPLAGRTDISSPAAAVDHPFRSNAAPSASEAAPLPPPSARAATPTGAPLPSSALIPIPIPIPISIPTTGPSPSASPNSAADDTKSESATLNFTSDLPARVSLDGALVGTTPLRGVRKSPGSHVVTVVSGELDERLTAKVELVRGQTTTVHAEFTRAVPALRVH